MPETPEEFIARAEAQQREYREWRERTDREDAEWRGRMDMARMRLEMHYHGYTLLAAAAMNPRINAEQLKRIAEVIFPLPRP